MFIHAKNILALGGWAKVIRNHFPLYLLRSSLTRVPWVLIKVLDFIPWGGGMKKDML